MRAVGRLRQLRDLVHDHLDPRRMPDVVLHRVQQRRAGRDHLGLAARRRLLHHRRARRWARSPRRCRRPAGSTTGRRGSASPAWGWFTGWFNLIGQIAVTAAIDYGAAIFVDVAAQPLVRHVADARPRSSSSSRSSSPLHLLINLVGLPIARDDQHDLGLVAHGRRRAHRRGADRRSRTTTSRSATCSARRSTTRGFSGTSFANPIFWFVFGIGLLMAQYTITGYDASAHMSEETLNAAPRRRASGWSCRSSSR